MFSRETLTEHKVECTHRRFGVLAPDVHHCICDMANGGSLGFDRLGVSQLTRDETTDGTISPFWHRRRPYTTVLNGLVQEHVERVHMHGERDVRCLLSTVVRRESSRPASTIRIPHS